jgi:hypothetical protein
VFDEFPLRRIVRKNPNIIPNRNNFLPIDFTYLTDEKNQMIDTKNILHKNNDLNFENLVVYFLITLQMIFYFFLHKCSILQ